MLRRELTLNKHIEFHETQIDSLLLKIYVNRLTCNEVTPDAWVPRSEFVKNWVKSRIKNTNNNPLPPTRSQVEPDQYQTKATTLNATPKCELRYRKPEKQPGLEKPTFHHQQQREWQLKREINNETLDIGKTINPKEPDSEDINISVSPESYFGKRFLLGPTPPGLS